MQSVSDALAVFERQVDGGIHMRADGIVVVVLLRVELVGEIANTHPQLEGQPAIGARRDGEVDERVEGKHLAQLRRDTVVSKARVIKGESDGRVVVEHLPTMLAVGVAMQRDLVTRGVTAVTPQSRVVFVVLEVHVAIIHLGLNLVILLAQLRSCRFPY